jgi:NADH-quinone oxidoreductase subunit E
MTEDLIFSKKLDAILSRYSTPLKNDLSRILMDAQNEFGYLNEQIIRKVSGYLGISATEAYGFASFYSVYKLKKPGRHLIRVCKGTACHVKGAKRLLSDIEEYLKIKTGQTTEDGLFTLDTSSCLGVCALSPVMMIDDKAYTRINSKIALNLIRELTGTHHES